MNTLENIRTELHAKVDDLVSKEVEKLKGREWYPCDGDVYFFVTAEGRVLSTHYKNNHIDAERKAVGSMFRTEKDAAKHLEALKVIAELRAYPGRKAFVADEDNNGLSIITKPGRVHVSSWRNISGGWQSIYFSSEEAAQSAINTVGEARILAAANWLSSRI